MLEQVSTKWPAASALTCLTEVELAMIGGRMARAFLVADAPAFDDLLHKLDEVVAEEGFTRKT
ncbi:hypothetical protein HJG53_01765 [Sphingomonas sp. ID1715]|uniref:hypothetical protein n=1 Tax=Sphingomonas sp. ID1715 TaxID=1656898 RepID=UPI0014895A2C|nr:hypothetical protein [Sphingomonas sp. ID1715]NNM75634.1 hypothetical protein [Sphingomonas sp. ID1715]